VLLTIGGSRETVRGRTLVGGGIAQGSGGGSPQLSEANGTRTEPQQGSRGQSPRWEVRGGSPTSDVFEFQRKIIVPKPPVSVAKPLRKANCKVCTAAARAKRSKRCVRVGVRGFLPREIFRNSCPFSAFWYTEKLLRVPPLLLTR